MTVGKPTFSTNRATTPFSAVKGEELTYSAKVKTNIQLLLNGLMKYDTKASVNTPEAEEDIQHKFRQFLIGNEFHMALEDFKDLLEESDQKPRDDGTTAWHHQFSQILLFLDKVKRGVIPLELLEEDGGLETCIRTIMRHDSLEDFGWHPDKFESMQKDRIERIFYELVSTGRLEPDSTWRTKEYQNLDILMNNLKLISKKQVVLDEDGKPIFDEKKGKYKKKELFPTLIAYIANMVHGPLASPIVFLFKTNDGSHNLGNMLMAPKFWPIKRKSYCNEREDMYGGRHAFPEYAQEKWPEFKEAFIESDNLMGAIIFLNFGYLATVDQKSAYPKNPKHQDGQEIYPSGLRKYLKGALAYSGPKAFSPLHNLIDDIQIIANGKTTIPEIKSRARLFLQHSVKAALKGYESHFPRLFSDPTIGMPTPMNDNSCSGPAP